MEISGDVAADADWAGIGVYVATGHYELVGLIETSLLSALTVVREEIVRVVALRDEHECPIELEVARTPLVTGRAGEADSEMLNRTSTLNIRSRNDSLAVLVQPVDHRGRKIDLDANVLYRVLSLRRLPASAFGPPYHLEWNSIIPQGRLTP